MLVTLPGSPNEVGPLTAVVSGGVVQRIVFGSGFPPAESPASLPDDPGGAPQDTHGSSAQEWDVADHLCTEIGAYFAGTLRSFSVPVDLGEVDTFARRVYSALLTVGYGDTVTYGQLADMAGRPGAARAVGNAMAANPWPILVPCHRVLPVSGGPGSYAGGAVAKSWLLALEAQPAP